MSTLDLIQQEIKSTQRWTEWMIEKIPEQHWNTTPEVLRTNMNWQIGHILANKCFHAVDCIVPDAAERTQTLPMDHYHSWYGVGSDPLTDSQSKPGKEQLLTHLNFIDAVTLEVLETLNAQDLDHATEVPNPVAKTKYEALMWCFKHQMWHNGQIAILARALRE